MEANSAIVVATSEPQKDASASAAAAAAGCGGGEEEISTGDNSLTSCEDDLSTPGAGAADETAPGLTLVGLLQNHRQPFPTPSIVIPPHPSSPAAPGSAARHTLASGLPSTLQLCKVEASFTSHELFLFPGAYFTFFASYDYEVMTAYDSFFLVFLFLFLNICVCHLLFY